MTEITEDIIVLYIIIQQDAASWRFDSTKSVIFCEKLMGEIGGVEDVKEDNNDDKVTRRQTDCKHTQIIQKEKQTN